MNYIIHLTDNCNLNCKYCYENKKNSDIDFEYIKDIIDYEISQKNKFAGIAFYGGEPLLKKDLIYRTIEYINSKKSKTKFNYTITTNGTLLDDEFITYLKENNFSFVGYSIDGDKNTQNLNRGTQNNLPTFDIVEENAKKVLSKIDKVVAMVAVTKNNIKYLSGNVKYLLNLGFKSINLQFNYLDKWEDDDLEIIRQQYKKVGEIYYEYILKEKDIDISLFEDKIKSYVKKEYNCNDNCSMGLSNVNIGTDGNIYPCMQFVYNKEYIIGNCKDGIDIEKRNNLANKSKKENEICKECLINKRCKHTCPCKNYMTTNDINGLSPLVCETERITVEIADEIANKLYKAKSKLFIQKYYNDKYHLIKEVAEKWK